VRLEWEFDASGTCEEQTTPGSNKPRGRMGGAPVVRSNRRWRPAHGRQLGFLVLGREGGKGGCDTMVEGRNWLLNYSNDGVQIYRQGVGPPPHMRPNPPKMQHMDPLYIITLIRITFLPGKIQVISEYLPYVIFNILQYYVINGCGWCVCTKAVKGM
jgi:hypothetical protein